MVLGTGLGLRATIGGVIGESSNALKSQYLDCFTIGKV
ncbi:hypothetical protein AM1_A0045 (plasmid) [Acaryochloris marina MBIC11017]|uniref:Uncharacterized protein n=1 Tax=Acaryochloris marina (strain MBIC 11017) TaxID=329726 RepID=A8ZK54_ACAM1|nr:hypothetical protein AM1_A0045 [Acaryochloris marina MBIC11017]